MACRINLLELQIMCQDHTKQVTKAQKKCMIFKGAAKPEAHPLSRSDKCVCRAESRASWSAPTGLKEPHVYSGIVLVSIYAVYTINTENQKLTLFCLVDFFRHVQG